MIMGDLKKNSIKEIWNNERYTKLRELHEKGEWYKHPICKDCEVPIVELYKILDKRNLINELYENDVKEVLVGEDIQKEFNTL